MNIKTVLMVGMAASLVACGGSKKRQPVEAGDAQVITTDVQPNVTVDTSKSVINWAGHKVGGSHQGTLRIKQGALAIQNEELQMGRFVIDMNSIVNLDLTSEKLNKQLVDHLKSADFFDVATYPEAKFEVVKATKVSDNRYQIDGQLTIKDITKSIQLMANITKNSDNKYVAVTDTFAIDRTQWGVNYGSKNIFKDLKDAIIHDAMDIQLVIETE